MSDSAKRLRSALSRFKSAANNKLRTDTVWALALDAGDDLYELHRRFAMLLRLPGEITADLGLQCDINIELYTSWQPDVDALFRAPWTHSSQEVAAHIRDTTLNTLDFCSDLLSRSGSAGVDEEQLNDLVSDVTRLRADVGNSKIDVDVKMFVLSRIDSILLALDYYKINGVAALRGAVESCLGSCYTNPDIAARVGEKERPFLRQVFSILSQITIILKIHDKAKELTEGVKAFLE